MRFFNYFDEISAQQKPANPQFFFLATIANHFPFNTVPLDRQLIYSNNKNFFEYYANSVRLCDEGLTVFFAELTKRNLDQSSIVIITADHAYPMGEHGNFHLEAGYHQESFRIPLFISWPAVLAPQIISQNAYSQMDIAPTIIDLLDLDTGVNNFQGESVFIFEKQKPTYLIQPYCKHLMVIDYPLKYRFYDQTQQEFVYNLEDDPLESVNIFNRLSESQKDYFRTELKKVYLNQLRIKNNLFQPQSLE